MHAWYIVKICKHKPPKNFKPEGARLVCRSCLPLNWEPGGGGLLGRIIHFYYLLFFYTLPNVGMAHVYNIEYVVGFVLRQHEGMCYAKFVTKIKNKRKIHLDNEFSIPSTLCITRRSSFVIKFNHIRNLVARE